MHEQNDMPVGLGMALAMNPEAMQKFASLSEAKNRKLSMVRTPFPLKQK